MKTRNRFILPLLLLLLLPGAGSASEKPVLERGWIGGKFAGARPAKALFFYRDVAKIIAGFPLELQPQYRGGVLITGLADGTPLRQAGARRGDLILAANDHVVPKVALLRRTIESLSPGMPLKLKIWRDHELMEINTVVGRERFKKSHYFQIGFGFSTDLDFNLFPGDNFSLVVLGYERNHKHLELHGTVPTYRRLLAPPDPKAQTEEKEMASEEGWRVWIACFAVGGNRQILSQEPVANAH
ncbi:MAG: PDZ domain-containing protein [Limisphaerales bacterium]